jgi:mannosyltransferase OCH1-like enzyme
MINLNFGLFWSGGPLSYLRYMTFKSLRHFHPHSRIQLFVANKCSNENYQWLREKQDFESKKETKDYIDALDDLNVEVVRADLFPQYPPNYQSDFFRWWFLYNNGGFYLDTDQIILKSFETLPLKSSVIYCKYQNPQCGVYTPVGVIGAQKKHKLIKYIMEVLPKYYDSNDYNSLGPWMFRSVMNSAQVSNSFNAPKEYFYPASNSDYCVKLYDGSFEVGEDSYALHWWGGHACSQVFNAKYTEKVAKKSNDTISTLLRENGVI